MAMDASDSGYMFKLSMVLDTTETSIADRCCSKPAQGTIVGWGHETLPLMMRHSISGSMSSRKSK